MKNVKKITIIAVLLIVILLSLLMLNYNVSAQASSLSPEELATSQKYDEELISYVHCCYKIGLQFKSKPIFYYL
ncbi:MAG: hypothetical protein OSJ74_09620 [Clostridia bacterium]|nr:hypothetical protein [Clostridia bacterium]